MAKGKTDINYAVAPKDWTGFCRWFKYACTTLDPELAAGYWEQQYGKIPDETDGDSGDTPAKKKKRAVRKKSGQGD